MTKKKWYRIDINTVSTTWETCECYIEAESEEEARAIFDADPDTSDWDNWDGREDELRSWDVERVEYDEWYTKHMADPDRLKGCKIQRRAIDMAEERIKETKDDPSM